MKLQLISDQGGDIAKFYADCVPDGISPSLSNAVEKAKKLLRYLEEQVEAPPQWLTISHLIIFYLSEEGDWRPEKARVFFRCGTAWLPNQVSFQTRVGLPKLFHRI